MPAGNKRPKTREWTISVDTTGKKNGFVADRMRKIDASGIRRIWQMAATMTDPVNFSIGEPDFGPPEQVKKAAITAIEQGKNSYTVTAGIQPLRDATAQIIADEFGWQRPNTLITCGLSGALHLAIMATVNCGDEVIVPDPYFVAYMHLVNLVGGKCVFVDTYPDFQLSAEKIEAAISERSKVLILNSPGNPTGTVYSENTLKNVMEVAKKHGLLVISDEIYRQFSYDRPAVSPGKYYENTLVLRGFSKTYGIPGWRLGFVAANENLAELMDQIATVQQYTFVCAPQPFQIAAINALNCNMRPQIEKYRQKRDAVYNGLKDNFQLTRPQGAFYAFVQSPWGTATEFVTEAIKNDVLVIPGATFSQKDSHFRISYATDDKMIQKGINRLCKLAKKGK